MTRLVYVSIISLPFIVYFLWKVWHIERNSTKYTEEYRYRFARRMVSIMKRNARIHTNSYGMENLPDRGGYVMYANHQGKYDSLGIISSHQTPCTVMMDEKRSHLILASQFITLLQGCRIDKTSIKTQINAIRQVINEVKSGRRYIIFPEGGYYKNQNNVQDFLPGAFKCAMLARSPIVPVALIDSYKPFGVNSLKSVTTQVHFLEPLYYEDYKGLSSKEISELVRERIMVAISKGNS